MAQATQLASTIRPAAPVLAPAAFYLPEIHIPGHAAYIKDRELYAATKAGIAEDIVSGELQDLHRVVAFDLTAGTSWDASKEIAHAVIDGLEFGEEIPRHVREFLEDQLGCAVVAALDRELRHAA